MKIFYMPPNLQQIWKHDEVRGKMIKNHLKKDLCEELDQIRISTRGKTLKEVQEITTAKNLSITIEEADIVKQVLWEWGLLDPEVQYVAKLKKDDPNKSGKGRILHFTHTH